MATDFTLPELGENIAAGDVLRVLVKAGDVLTKDQPVLELETDKATIEVPSSVAGQVKEIKVKAGDKVKVGQTILSVEGGEAAAAAPAARSREDRRAGRAGTTPLRRKLLAPFQRIARRSWIFRAECALRPPSRCPTTVRPRPPRRRFGGWRANSASTSAKSPARATKAEFLSKT